MHGQYIGMMDIQLIREEDTILWLSRGYLIGQIGGEIIAVQDQALQTEYHATKILRTERVSKCQLCK